MRVHQAVLGYDRGHRLIGSSTDLNSLSKHLLLQLSDRAVEVKKIPKCGYLTGYPLAEDGLYVLARTWAAPEMPRPGCIWTHSLFVSFTQLAQLEDPRSLLPAFRRPSLSEGAGTYTLAIGLEIPSRTPVDRSLAAELLVRLYLESERKVFVSARDQESTDETLLAIWGQQWPRIRRSFRFCTLTSEDRSMGQHWFDVQVVVGKHAARDTSPKHVQRLRNAWLDLCLADLDKPNANLRSFLRRAGGDISEGRPRFSELCRLFAEREAADEVVAVEQTLQYVVHRLPAGEGRLLRSSAIADAARLARDISTEHLIDILPYLDDYADDIAEKDSKRLAQRYWQINPSILIGATGVSCLRSQADWIIESLGRKEAIDLVVLRGDEVAQAILNKRQDLLEEKAIWLSGLGPRVIEVASKISDENRRRSVLSAIVDAARFDLIDTACTEFGAEAVLFAAISKTFEQSESAMRFAEEAIGRIQNKEETVISLIQGTKYPLSRSLIHLLSRHVSPRVPGVAIESNGDPWVAAWRNASGDLGARDIDDVMIFFFVRAIVEPSADAASLIAYSFDRLLDMYSSAKLMYAKRARLVNHLVLADWCDWSFESRLTRTAATVAFTRKFSVSQLTAVSKKKSRVLRVVRAISFFDEGGAYLRAMQG